MTQPCLITVALLKHISYVMGVLGPRVSSVRELEKLSILSRLPFSMTFVRSIFEMFSELTFSIWNSIWFALSRAGVLNADRSSAKAVSLLPPKYISISSMFFTLRVSNLEKSGGDSCQQKKNISDISVTLLVSKESDKITCSKFSQR